MQNKIPPSQDDMNNSLNNAVEQQNKLVLDLMQQMTDMRIKLIAQDIVLRSLINTHTNRHDFAAELRKQSDVLIGVSLNSQNQLMEKVKPLLDCYYELSTRTDL